MDYKNTLPQVDHGIDVCGDEWDEEPVIYEKKFDPKHPYCTNWPVKIENARLGRIATQIDGHAAEAELELEELERQLAREKIKGQANVAELRAVKEEWSVLQRHNRELRTVAEEQDDEINRLRRLIEDEAYNDEEEIAWRRIADVV